MTDRPDGWEPSRPVSAHRRAKGSRGALTAQQQALADDLHVRALALRAASEDGLSIREAVELAAHQLGVEVPQNDTEGTRD